MYRHKLACQDLRVSVLFYVFRIFFSILGKIGWVENLFSFVYELKKEPDLNLIYSEKGDAYTNVCWGI